MMEKLETMHWYAFRISFAEGKMVSCLQSGNEGSGLCKDFGEFYYEGCSSY